MGTNYYWRVQPQTLPNGTELHAVIDRDNPAIHIGKRNVGAGQCLFIWAQPPDEVRQLCNDSPSTPLIEDEYGKPYTGADFLHMIGACDESTESVGGWFA